MKHNEFKYQYKKAWAASAKQGNKPGEFISAISIFYQIPMSFSESKNRYVKSICLPVHKPADYR